MEDNNFLHSLSEILEWNSDIGFAYCDHIVVDQNHERKQSINTLKVCLEHILKTDKSN